MTTQSFKNSKQEFNFGPWKLTANKSHIMKSKDIEKLAEEMKMHSLPEMLFGDNVLKVQHAGGFGIVFNATDALKTVDNGHGTVKVACADAWQESRADSEHSKVVKPYDWTFTTNYKGTLLGDNLKLKRVMPSSFFVLLRFFLRVDGVLIRTNDTRVYHEADKNYLLSEYSSRESYISALQNVPQYLFTDPNEISQYLPLKQLTCEKLEFPEDVNNSTVFGNVQICVNSDEANRESRQT
ncbi:TIP41-like protein isoform X2 [Rhinoraja longicauda]